MSKQRFSLQHVSIHGALFLSKWTACYLQKPLIVLFIHPISESCFAVSCVYMAERLNIWLSRRWTLFARQPYFDHNGIFMSTVWSGPLLLISCIILVSMKLYEQVFWINEKTPKQAWLEMYMFSLQYRWMGSCPCHH